jgi:UDP-N-acetyl-D-glucosamine dehydrogenase
LLENAFRLVNIAFINEFAELCRRMGITAADVIDAAATKPFAFMKHTPGVGAGGTCIPTVSRYLLEAARHNDLELPILRDAVDGNAHLVDRVVKHLDQLLRANAVSRARVLVVGATYKPNYPDTRGSAALRFARELGARHKVTVYDPIVDTTRWPADLALVREPPRPASYDAVVVAVRHRQVDLDALRQAGPIFIDLVRGSVEVDESIPTRK